MYIIKQKHEWTCKECGRKIDINKEPIFVLINDQSYYICYYCAMRRYTQEWKRDKRFFHTWIELNTKKPRQTFFNLLRLEKYKQINSE